MEEFTPYPVADQEEARPPLFLDQTEAETAPLVSGSGWSPPPPPLSEGLHPNPQPTVLADFPPYPTCTFYALFIWVSMYLARK